MGTNRLDQEADNELTLEQKVKKDEIDYKIIDQLHNATLNFSKTTLELKKILFVIIGIVVSIFFNKSGSTIDNSLFLTICILIFAFWFFDSFAYYYQEKLREGMDKRFKKIQERYKIIDKDEHTLEDDRESDFRYLRSFINSSNLAFYPIMLILDLLAWLFLK